MRVVVTAEGPDIGAPANPNLGRCPAFVFVDTETMALEAMENPAAAAAGGAGIRAAQIVAERGAEAVVTGDVGPNAAEVLQAAGVRVYLYKEEGTVRQAVQAFRAGRLPEAGGATVAQYGGLGGAEPAASSERDAEIVALQKKMHALRARLAEVVTRLDELEKESQNANRRIG